MQYTALTRTITNSDTAVSSSDIGKTAQFFDTNGYSYWGLILSVISDSSFVIDAGENLPLSDMQVYNLSVVGDPAPDPAQIGIYCTQQDIQYRIGLKNLCQLTNDSTSSQLPDSDVVNSLIEKACSDIDNILSGTYSTPFNPTPRIIKQIAIDLTIYNAMLRRFSIMEVPKQWIAAYDKAMEKLERLSKLDESLGPDYPIAASGARIVAPSRVVDFSDSSNNFSGFMP